MNGFNMSNASNITIGGTTVSAVYIGSTLVWPLGPQPHDYSRDYLTIESLVNTNSIYWFYLGSHGDGSGYERTIEISTDNGSTWTSKTSSTSGEFLATLNTGDKLLIKGYYYSYSDDENNYNSFASGAINVYGNIMSLIYGTSFINQTTLPSNYTFNSLFLMANIHDASNLILPATTLVPFCYYRMFQSNNYMTAAPELHAAILASYSYAEMFNGCTRLDNITCLATDISATNCTRGWVTNVAASGTFTKSPAMSNWTTGRDGVPSGWTVQDAS